MAVSVFDLFKIGIGPSSSHTVGPMRASARFVTRWLEERGILHNVARIRGELFGSLAHTGRGHGTDKAVLCGFEGEWPDKIDPDSIPTRLARIRGEKKIRLLGKHEIAFDEKTDLVFNKRQKLPYHSNGMRFTAFDNTGAKLTEEVFYSVGGGFIVSEAERTAESTTSARKVPYPFRSSAELLATADSYRVTIAELILANECELLSTELLNETSTRIQRPGRTTYAVIDLPLHEQIKKSILAIWQVMQQCTERGIATEGILPGGLNVRRRAHRLAERLNTIGSKDPLAPIDWVTVYAMAVNEENAAGGRVVTAPTNGAAGVIPAIANYYTHFIEGTPEEKTEGLIRYFLTAAAIGILYKENASISGAEVGCQGEVGVACSMAAGGLVAALNGTNEQVEHAAEIAMEHNLGMTCDPIGGLVQIPCIERNGMGAVKAINACRMAMHETGDHKLSLDQVIATMYQTGLDMQSRYKETSLAGLALNIIEC